MKSHKLSLAIAVAVFLAVPTLLGSGIHAKQPSLSSTEKTSHGEYSVFVQCGDQWRQAGRLAFNQFPREKRIDLSAYLSGRDAETIRLVQSGGGAAHIDAITLGGEAPRAVAGIQDSSILAKLQRQDLDVLDSFGKTLDLTFPRRGLNGILSLTARVEPQRISDFPFQFPTHNLFRPVNDKAMFYTYTLSRDGSGEGNSKELLDSAKPFFKEYCRTGSGHPPGLTYGWVRNDEQNLYVRLDFTPDNTRDGDKDYAEIHLKTDNGIRSFRMSEADTRWGKPEFTSTEKAAYPHKVYNFTVPLAELTAARNDGAGELKLAFSAYGTAAPERFMLDAGERHVAAIHSDGTLWTWGDNEYGQLGDGTTADRNTPDQAPVGDGWVAVSVGVGHTVALRADGTLWAWGWNEYGQLGNGTTTDSVVPVQVVYPSADGWVAISAREYQTFALRYDGTLWAWGYNGSGQLGIGRTSSKNSPVQVAAGTQVAEGWVQVWAGEDHTVALRSDGTLWAWGFNRYGQLGDGTEGTEAEPTLNNRTSPVQVLAPDPQYGDKWVGASVGDLHTVALRSDGTLWAWGWNGYGNLGTGDRTNSNTPVQVVRGDAPSDNAWVDVAVGNMHTVALRSDGTLWSWGYNSQGQLGDGLAINPLAYRTAPGQVTSPAPPDPPSAYGWMAAWADGNYAFALQADGTLWSWGANDGGQLGIGTTGGSTSSPFLTGNGYRTLVLAAGHEHSLAVDSDGTLHGWGWNANHQLGLGDTTSDRTTAAQVGNDRSWSTVSATYGYSVGLKSDGSLWAWGVNDQGQLGLGDKTERQTPAQVVLPGTGEIDAPNHDWKAVSAGWTHTLALKSDGTLWTWGENTSGQLGTGNNSQQLAPVQVVLPLTQEDDPENHDWTAISAGYYHSLALKSDGSLWAWGLNGSGQLGVGDTGNWNSPQQVRLNGTLGTDPVNHEWVAVSAGGNTHTVALRADGTLWAWGWNDGGLLGLGTGDTLNRYEPEQVLLPGTTSTDPVNHDWVAISAAARHTLALKANGTLWAWGFSGSGELGLGQGVFTQLTPAMVGSDMDWVAVTAGPDHTLARKEDGTLWSWGFNGHGQLATGGTISRGAPGQFGLGPLAAYFRDLDGDGYGDPAVSVQTTYRPSDYVTNNLDPDDSNPAINPGTLIPQAERVALIALYNSTNGSGWDKSAWTNETNWRLPDDSDFRPAGTECTWYGVTCDGNRVAGLNLSSRNLVGSLPGEIGDLTAIRMLILWGNRLSGSIPNSVGNLTALEHLSLSSNQLTGSIPSTIGSLIHLQGLNLNDNQLTGSIPVAVGNLQALKNLMFNDNQLTGTIPVSIGGLASLESLYLHNNQLDGSIPAELGNMTNLQVLSLGWNQLSGSIPAVLGNLARLTNLALDGNQLTGTIPASIVGLSAMETLWLGSNQLTGSMPLQIGNLTNLQRLGLEWNQLTGEIPPEIGNLTALTDLYLDGNQLTGTIPQQISGLTNLQQLGLSENQLTGEIPQGIWNLVQLQYLWLYGNGLTGNIPNEIGNLAQLRSLHLGWNQLTGMIPPQIGGLVNLEELRLGGNPFIGNIPPELGNLVNLRWLELYWNGLSGSIPPEIGSLTHLQELWLNNNQLSGPIPGQLANLTGLIDGSSDFRSNGLHTSDGTLRSFLASKQMNGGDWESTQDLLSVTVTFGNFSAGAAHNLSVRSDGSLWAWGGNGSGQLGTGDTVLRASPVPVGNGTDWMAVSAGSAHSLALQADGSLWAWGDNGSGQLGDGTGGSRLSPVRIGSDTDWVAVSAGASHSLALKTDGRLYAWGANDHGQLGDGAGGAGVSQLAPIRVGSDADWVAISAGGNHSLGVKADGTLWAWGDNSSGQLGDGTGGPGASRLLPVQVLLPGTLATDPVNHGWMRVSAGTGHTLALKWDGTLWAWGDNSSGQLGDGSGGAGLSLVSPVQVGSGTDWVAISAGASHSMALKVDGRLWTWGSNSSGQLGIGSADSDLHSTPVLAAYKNWIAITAGNDHGLGLQADGTFRSWGMNGNAQLGLGDTVNRTFPSAIPLAPPLTYYRDADGDGYGDPAVSLTAFSKPDGYVLNNQDTNDSVQQPRPTLVAPYIQSCNVMVYNAATGVIDHPAKAITSMRVAVFDPGGALPGSIASVKITGPDSSVYHLTAQHYAGGNEFYFEIAEYIPAEGEYTFEVEDDEGLIARSTCYHHSGILIPVADTQTFQAVVDPLDSSRLRLSWGGVKDYEGDLYYRVRVFSGPSDLSGVWTSGFTSSTYVTVGQWVNQPGFLWRVEAFDNYRFDISDQRSISGKVSLVVPEDPRPYFEYARICNRHRPDGFFTFPTCAVRIPNGTVPGDLSSLKVELLARNQAPQLIYSFDPRPMADGGDYDPYWNEFYRSIPLPAGTRPVNGIYRFTAVDRNGRQAVTHDYLESYDVPIVPTASMQASGNPYASSGPTLTFSWGAPAGLDRPLYYQTMFSEVDALGNEIREVWRSSIITGTSVTVPVQNVLPLNSGKQYRWKVRAYEKKNGIHYNRSDSEWIPLAIDNSRPYFTNAVAYRSRYAHGDYTAFDVYVMDPGGSAPDTIESVTVNGPNGFFYEYQTQDIIAPTASSNYVWEWWYGAPSNLPPGVYTITATNRQGGTAVTHDYLGPADFIPYPGQDSIRVYPFTNPVVSWDGVGGFEDHLFYRVRLADASDRNGIFGGREPVTAFTIPINTFPAQPTCEVAPRKSYIFRIELTEDPDWAILDQRTATPYVPFHPQLDVASLGTSPGAIIRVPITLRNAPGVSVHSTSNTIVFDPARLEFQGVEIGPAALAAGKNIAFEHPYGGDNGKVRVMIEDSANPIGAGTVASVLFRVNDSPAGDGTVFQGSTTLGNCPTAYAADGSEIYASGDWGEIKVLPQMGSCGPGGGGATSTVSPGSAPTIQEALDAAQDGDTVLVSPGLYPVDSLTFNGKKITLTCNGAPGSCILDGAGMTRIFKFISGEDRETTICGFTIQNGYADYGAAMYLINASPTVNNCTMVGNTAPTGGAIYSRGGSPLFQGCTIASNTAGNGGAVYSDGSSPAFSRCGIFSNSAKLVDGSGRGGAVYTVNGGAPFFVSCLIAGNEAGASGGAGGAIHAESANVTLTNCTLAENKANGAGARGGAVSTGAAVVTITNSILWGDLQNGLPNEINGNAVVAYSDVQGGYPGTGNINLEPLFLNAANGHLELRPDSPCIDQGSSTVAGGVGTQDFYGKQRISGAAVDLGAFESVGRCYTDSDGDGYGVGSVVSEGWTCPAGQAPNNLDCNDSDAGIHPGVAEVCDGVDNNCDGRTDVGCVTWYRDADGDGYGDPNDSIAAMEQPAGYVANSEDIDDTDPGIHPELWYSDLDGDGYSDGSTQVSSTRPAGFKLPSELVATSGDCSDTDARVHPGAIAIVNGVDYDCNGSVDTIQGALNMVSSGGTVVVATGTHFVNDLDFGGKDIRLVCGGVPGSCVLDGSSTSRVLHLHDGETAAAIISGFVIQNGSSLGPVYDGGGMFLDNASPTFEDCLVTSNRAGVGGGAYTANGSSPTFRRCSFVANTAIEKGGAVFAGSPGTYVNCLFSDNTTQSGGASYGGGAIFTNFPVLIANCTIVENRTGLDTARGGALYNNSASTQITNSIIWDNVPDGIFGYAAQVSTSDVQGGYGDPDDMNIAAEPQFVNTSNRDFRLTESSPCVNRGSNTALGIEALDLAGSPRIAGGTVDMGAYEHPCAVTWFADQDDDGYSDGTFTTSCTRPAGPYKAASELATDGTRGDCNDSDAGIHPGVAEVCDGLDNNCDGSVDEGCPVDTWYQDRDGDGFGNPRVTSPTGGAGWVSNGADCDDMNSAVNPSAAEVCDGIDNNCNGAFDEGCVSSTWYEDADGDGYGNPKVFIPSWSTVPPAGYAAKSGDCNDSNDAVHPGAAEICDGIDNNCNGHVDEGCSSGMYSYFRDADGDGYGDPRDSIVDPSPIPPEHYVDNGLDCNDTCETCSDTHPGAVEVCDGYDNNCNGIIDEGCELDSDGDGVMDSEDNCPFTYNPPPEVAWVDKLGMLHEGSQTDFNLNGIGDVVDDTDYDGLTDALDPCHSDPENDLDGDGVCSGAGFKPGTWTIGDRIVTLVGEKDNCPAMNNPPAASWIDHEGNVHVDSQPDYNLNGIGDLCDAETVTSSEPPPKKITTTPPPPPDSDGDGIYDAADNCPATSNPIVTQWTDKNGNVHSSSQPDFDLDGIGDACDLDLDGDGVPDKSADLSSLPVSSGGDNCPRVPNPPVASWTDTKGTAWTNSQPDIDLDKMGDVCDDDMDEDGLSNDGDVLKRQEATFGTSPTNPDTDGDGILDGVDDNPLVNAATAAPAIVFKAYKDTTYGTEVTSSWLPTRNNSVVLVAFLRTAQGALTHLAGNVTFTLTPSRLEGAATNDVETCPNAICSNDFSFSSTDKNVLTKTVTPGPGTQVSGLTAAPAAVFSFDYGGKTTVSASTTYGGAAVQGSFTLPLDSDGDGLPDAWEVQNGLSPVDAFSLDGTRARTDGQMDVDASADNTLVGDGLSNFREYRGILYDTPGGLLHQRLDPRKKDLFVRGDGFKNSTPCLAASPAAFCSTADLLPFNIGALEGEDFSNAFEEAGIAVHDVTGLVSFSGAVEPPNIDIVVVTNNTTSTNTIRQAFSPGINQAGIRYWTWDEKGASYFGDASRYQYDPATGASGTYVYHLNLMHYIWNRPYLENPTSSLNKCPGMLDPLAMTEDGIKLDNGAMDTGEDANRNKTLDWDRLDPTWKTGLTAASYRVGKQFSVFDADGDGLVELPVLSVCAPPAREYTVDEVQRHTIIHEMGHAVGIRNPEHTSDSTCVMYGTSNNWDRAGHFCPAARSQIQIHNK